VITPEQKKKIMIMAGVFVVALIALVVILIKPASKPAAPTGNETVATQPAPAETAQPASPGTGAPTTPPAPQGNAPGNPPASTGMPPAKMGATTAGVMSKPAPPLIPPTVLPSLTPPISLSSKYDPFSGGPRPPKPPVVINPTLWVDTKYQRIYDSIMDKSAKTNTANVSEGEIYIAYIPFVHNSSLKATPYVPVPRKEDNIETPPGRNAGYVYSEGGKVYAIFEDQTHQPKAVSVGDQLNGYTVKAISYNSLTLTNGIRDFQLKLQPIDTFQWGSETTVDADPNVPVNSPPRWGNR